MGNAPCLAGVQGPVPRTPKRGFKVCVCGCAGKVGQPLCLQLALDPRVQELSVFDLTISLDSAEGIGMDLAHLDRRCTVKAYSLETTQQPAEHLEECLQGCHLVVLIAGVPQKNKTRSDHLKINMHITKSLVEATAKYCPQAIVGVIVNPIISIVPAMASLYEKKGLDPLKICGITGLDTVRANRFVHEETGAPIESINVPVIGGFSAIPETVLPLYSQDRAARQLDRKKRAQVTERIEGASEKVLAASKKGKSAGGSLSTAYAAARFCQAVLSGLSSQRAVEMAYVKAANCPTQSYFTTQVTFGPKGVERVHPLPTNLSKEESWQLEQVVKKMESHIEEGLEYADGTSLALGGP